MGVPADGKGIPGPIKRPIIFVDTIKIRTPNVGWLNVSATRRVELFARTLGSLRKGEAPIRLGLLNQKNLQNWPIEMGGGE